MSNLRGMKVGILGSTKPQYQTPIEEAVKFSGASAGICYMPDDIKKLFSEPSESTDTRVKRVVEMGHHSVFGHVMLNLYLENVPKILAMVLNNEKAYTTSEKSARYTKMKPSVKEQVLYEKWLKIFTEKVISIDPNTPLAKAEKIAQENARYLISVFTPTNLEYTVSLQQLNYIRGWFADFIAAKQSDKFMQKLKPVFQKFIDCTDMYHVEGLVDKKGRKLSIFDERDSRSDEFGENYCVSYLGTFAQLAQAHRHRTISYAIRMLDRRCFYIPVMIRGNGHTDEWLKDIQSVADLYPQGMLVSICERGTYENFILKAKERLCSAAQLEISKRTFDTLQVYANHVGEPIRSELQDYRSGARCGAGYKCPAPCAWGVKQQDRLF